MIDAATKVAGSITDALRSQPLALALLVFNLVFMGLVWHATQSNIDRYDRQLHSLIDLCAKK
jgi:hypothetical protein